MIIGTTFSHRQSAHLKLPETAFREILDMGFGSIRLVCYWDEIEQEKGNYDFSIITELLDLCEERKQKVIVTVGMKAPRWPEFYFPKWLADKTPSTVEPFVIPFLYKSIEELRKYSVITAWQVENEPLDPSGPKHMSIPLDVLKQEIGVVREKDSRPILINIWGNEVKKRKILLQVKNIADIIGLDIYYKVPVFGPIYRGPLDSDAELTRMGKQTGKRLFITELQAEPWERNTMGAKSGKTPSMDEDILEDNFNRAAAMSPEAIYLWGSEFWLSKKQKGDDGSYRTVRKLINSET